MESGSDPFILVVTGSITVGLIFNIAGIKRPEFYSSINSLLIPKTSFLLLSTIGMTLHASQTRRYFREGFIIASIKFLIIPTLMTICASFFGLGKIDQGLPMKVVLILSSMPVGFTAMVATMIYDLDMGLAGSSWLITNSLLFLIAPMLFL